MTALDTFIDKLPAIITALGVLGTAIGTIFTSYWSYKAQIYGKSNSGAIAETKAAVEQQSFKQ